MAELSPGAETSEHALAREVIADANRIRNIAGVVAGIAASAAVVPLFTLPATIVGGVAGAVAGIATLIPMFMASKYTQARVDIKVAAVTAKQIEADVKRAAEAATALKNKVTK